MSVAVKKLEGVESVDVSLEKSSAVIVLKPDNKVTLSQLRRVIRNSGYPTRDAQVSAKGTIMDRGGKPVLDLLNGSFLDLTEIPKGAPAGPVEIAGVSRLVGKDIERLTITVDQQKQRLWLPQQSISPHPRTQLLAADLE